jgi:hypothetical protein
MCSFAGAEVVVEATVEAGPTPPASSTSPASRTPWSPGLARHHPRAQGAALGEAERALVGCVSGDGTSIQGPLQTAPASPTGYFFIIEADGYAVVVNQGFFRRDGNLLKNPGVPSRASPSRSSPASSNAATLG